MSFRKRATPLARTDRAPAQLAPPAAETSAGQHGEATAQSHDSTTAQPSNAPPQAAHATASPPVHATPSPALPATLGTIPTGLPTLDTLLSRPAGLPLGTSLLILERGAADSAGALLRIAAAQALLRGEVLHVVGNVGDAWVRGLPGVDESASRRRESVKGGSGSGREMKIAWRYEGVDMARGAGREATFDMTARLAVPPGARVHHHALDMRPGAGDPFKPALESLTRALASAPSTFTSSPVSPSTSTTTTTTPTIHRIIIPSLLSPALYPPSATHPRTFLPFMHALRAFLRRHSRSAAALLSLPVDAALAPSASAPSSLNSSASGLGGIGTAGHPALRTWAEHLADGVLEMAPFPHRLGAGRVAAGLESSASSSSTGTGEKAGRTERNLAVEEPQGLLRVRKLPVVHERGVGGVRGLGTQDDWAYALGRRRFDVARYTLPVDAEEDGPATAAATGGSGEGEAKDAGAKMPSAKALEF